jgi:excisionase family DNA binding protein
MKSEPWVTVIKIALHLSVVKNTVYGWYERERLPAQKIGRLLKLQLSGVDEWVRPAGMDEADRDGGKDDR